MTTHPCRSTPTIPTPTTPNATPCGGTCHDQPKAMVANARHSSSRKGNELMACITKRKFGQAIRILTEHPEEAQYVGSHGDTALHLACNIYPDVSLVRALLKAYPDATNIRNGFGCAPLHVACRGSSDEVVRLLLAVDASAAKSRNKDGNLPIELLCWYRLESMIVHEALDVEDAKDILLHDPQLQRIWRCSRYLVQAAFTGQVTKMQNDYDTSFSMVHACTQMPECPLHLMMLAVKLLPSQLSKADEDGCVPLHYMIRNASMPWKQVLEKVFRAYPGAAAIKDPLTGMHPFMMLAIDNRAPFHAVYDTLRACPELDRMGLVAR